MASDGCLTPPTPDADSCSSAVSEEEVALLEKWKRDCKAAADMHRKAYRLYKTGSHICSSVSIGLSSISGIVTIVLTATLAAPPIAIVSGVASVAVSTILAVGSAMDLEQKMHLHNQYANFYGELVRDIQQEHTLRKLGRSQYQDIAEFIKIVSDKLDRLEMNEPDQPKC